MRTKKAFMWTMAIVLAAIAIPTLYLQRASGPVPSDVYKAEGKPEVKQQAKLSQPALAKIDQADVDRSGAVGGQLLAEADPLDPKPEATGLFPAGMEPARAVTDRAEVPAKIEQVEVDRSGVAAGQIIEEDRPSPPTLAATGI